MKKTSPLWLSTAAILVQFGPLAYSQNVIFVGPNVPDTIKPVDRVTLNDNGTVVVQNDSQPTNANFRRNNAVFIDEILLLNGDALELFNFEGADVVLQNFANQQPSGIGVIESDGTVVRLAGSRTGQWTCCL